MKEKSIKGIGSGREGIFNFLINILIIISHINVAAALSIVIAGVLDSSATDCVAVVHQRISQLNSSGLMNIKSSHKLTRSGDTASGCIEGVNMEDYQVGVVGGRRLSLLTTETKSE